MEINGFRELNEAHGYQRGDALLRETSDALTAACVQGANSLVVHASSVSGDELGTQAWRLLLDQVFEEGHLPAWPSHQAFGR